MKFCRFILIMMAVAWYGPVFAGSSLSVHVREAPVRSVLEGLARSGNINLIVDDTVQGTMTMHVDGVTVEDALDAIAASQNLYYEKEGPVRTMTAGKKRDGAKSLRTWRLRYAVPTDAAGASRRAGPRGSTGYEAAAGRRRSRDCLY